MTTVRIAGGIAALAAVVFLSAPETVLAADDEIGVPDGPQVATPDAAGDPDAGGENLMRFLFEVNKGVDTLFVRPVATFYKSFTPPEAQQGIHNVASNLRAPIVFANDMLQGEEERAGVTLERALINTTAGFLGWNDKAAEMGLEGHDEDFGQTLAVWGMEDGPYMVLPVLGPSNPRDAVGSVVDFLTMPPGVGAVQAVDKRAAMDSELEAVEKSSVDHYAAIRSMYQQNRRYEISNNAEPAVEVAGEDFPSVDTADFGQGN